MLVLRNSSCPLAHSATAEFSSNKFTWPSVCDLIGSNTFAKKEMLYLNFFFQDAGSQDVMFYVEETSGSNNLRVEYVIAQIYQLPMH